LTSYLLDSNVLIDWLLGRQNAVSLLDRLASDSDVIAVDAIAIAETYSGLREDDEPRADGLISSFDYWPIGYAEARLAGWYRYRYARRGRAYSTTDMLLATHAISRGATLVTGNIRDFPMPELKVLRLGH
jgi:predicted nucleic acid-binding protein